MIEITDLQAAHIINNAEIPPEITASADRVAVVLTQDWCPQWVVMKKWLPSMKEQGIKVFHLSYNRKPYSEEFMRVKENQWKNYHIPYVRYYTEGRLTGETNYAGEKTFLSKFQPPLSV